MYRAEHGYVVKVETLFSLPYKVFGVVQMLFLQVLHFFRLWSWLQWCFPNALNRAYVTADG